MVRQNVQVRIGMKTTTRQHKTAPKHRRGRVFGKRLRCREPSQSIKNQRWRLQCMSACFRQKSPQMEDAIFECGGAGLGVVSRRQAGELAQERSMTERRLALQTSLALDHKRRWKRALHHAAKHNKGGLHVGQPLWFWRRGANAAKKPTNAFWHPGVVIIVTLSLHEIPPFPTRWPLFGLPTAVPSSSVHDPRRDRFTTMTRRHMSTSRNT